MTLRQIYRSVVICIRSVKRIVVRSFKIRHGKPLRYSVNIILRNVVNFNEIDLYSEWQMYSGPWLVRIRNSPDELI
jgi:chemotaxis methyl-accepting protein methylase